MNYKDLQHKFLEAMNHFDQIQLSKGAFLIDESDLPVPQVPELEEGETPDYENGETGYEHYAWVRVWAMIPSQEVYRNKEEERQGFHVIKKHQIVEELVQQMQEQGVPEEQIVQALQQVKDEYDSQVALEKPIFIETETTEDSESDFEYFESESDSEDS